MSRVGADGSLTGVRFTSFVEVDFLFHCDLGLRFLDTKEKTTRSERLTGALFLYCLFPSVGAKHCCVQASQFSFYASVSASG